MSDPIFEQRMHDAGLERCQCCNDWCNDVKPKVREKLVVRICGDCDKHTNQGGRDVLEQE